MLSLKKTFCYAESGSLSCKYTKLWHDDMNLFSYLKTKASVSLLNTIIIEVFKMQIQMRIIRPYKKK
jgi:hypothetical protein